MNEHRPRNIIGVLVLTAIVGFLGSALLDEHRDWGSPRQAAANVLWIVFLLSVLSLLVATARLLLRRRQPSAN